MGKDARRGTDGMQPRPNGVPQLDLKQIGNKNAQQSPASSSSTTAGSDRNTTPIVLSPQQQQKQGEPGSSSKPLRRNGTQGKRPPQGNVSFYTNTQPRPTSSGGLTPRTFLGQSRSKDSISNGARRRGNVLEPQWGQGDQLMTPRGSYRDIFITPRGRARNMLDAEYFRSTNALAATHQPLGASSSSLPARRSWERDTPSIQASPQRETTSNKNKATRGSPQREQQSQGGDTKQGDANKFHSVAVQVTSPARVSRPLSSHKEEEEEEEEEEKIAATTTLAPTSSLSAAPQALNLSPATLRGSIPPIALPHGTTSAVPEIIAAATAPPPAVTKKAAAAAAATPSTTTTTVSPQKQQHHQQEISLLENTTLPNHQAALIAAVSEMQPLRQLHDKLVNDAAALQIAVARAQAATAARRAEIQELEALVVSLQATLDAARLGELGESDSASSTSGSTTTAAAVLNARVALLQIMHVAAGSLQLPSVVARTLEAEQTRQATAVGVGSSSSTTTNNNSSVSTSRRIAHSGGIDSNNNQIVPFPSSSRIGTARSEMSTSRFDTPAATLRIPDGENDEDEAGDGTAAIAAVVNDDGDMSSNASSSDSDSDSNSDSDDDDSLKSARKKAVEAHQPTSATIPALPRALTVSTANAAANVLRNGSSENTTTFPTTTNTSSSRKLHRPGVHLPLLHLPGTIPAIPPQQQPPSSTTATTTTNSSIAAGRLTSRGSAMARLESIRNKIEMAEAILTARVPEEDDDGGGGSDDGSGEHHYHTQNQNHQLVSISTHAAV